MKKIIVAVTFILVCISGSAQLVQQDSTLTKLQPTDYLQKSKKQKTAGWILLAASAVSGISGFGMVLNEAGNSINDAGNNAECIFGGCSNPPPQTYNSGRATAGVILMGVGTVSLVSSIVLFSKSGKNKRKAMSVSYRPMNAPLLGSGGAVSIKPIPAFTLTLTL
jgi:hypothetical protein